MNLAYLKLLFVCIVALFCSSCAPAEYRHFIAHDQAYFKDLADACDSVLTNGPVLDKSELTKLVPQNESLPKIIREFNPAKIYVTTNSVLIWIEKGLNSCGIVWRQSEEEGHTWILGAYTEGTRQDVYSRKKLMNNK